MTKKVQTSATLRKQAQKTLAWAAELQAKVERTTEQHAILTEIAEFLLDRADAMDGK